MMISGLFRKIADRGHNRLNFFVFVGGNKLPFDKRNESCISARIDHTAGCETFFKLAYVCVAHGRIRRKQAYFFIFRQQYAYLVDYPNLVQKIFSAYCYFIYLKESPNFKTNHFLVLPAGDYLCYRARILTEEWDPSPLREYFVNRPPILVIANELEENLVTYDEAQYELQMLLSRVF